MKTAVFYDLENLGLTSKNSTFMQSISNLRKKIEASELVGEITLQKAYIRKDHASRGQIESVIRVGLV